MPKTGTEITLRIVFGDDRDADGAALAVAQHLAETFNDDESISFIERMGEPELPIDMTLYDGRNTGANRFADVPDKCRHEGGCPNRAWENGYCMTHQADVRGS